MATSQTPLLPHLEARNATHRRRRPARCTKTRFVLGIMILTFGWIIFLRSRRALVPSAVDHSFGVAFDLTSPYGTAAISYPNGTIVNVAKIYAPPSYREMMSRLSLPSSEHLNPPYNSLPDYFSDQPRQALRASRKAAGLPASSDVGELAKLITALRLAVEHHLDGRKITGAVATIPGLVALYEEDLADAFEYVGLIYLAQYPYWYGGVFSEASAVYNGNGFGMCSNYTDEPSCKKEKSNPPHQAVHERVLTLSYTSGILTSTWSIKSMGFSYPGSDVYKFVDLNLGWDNRNQNPNDAYYWEAIRDAVIKPALKARQYQHEKTDKVFLHGDHSMDERFQQVVREVLDRALENKPHIFELDPVYSAARGAAEMAKIEQWRYNQTNSSTGIGG